MANFKKLKLNTYLKKLGRFFALILSDIAEFLTSLHKFSRAPENNSVFKAISSKSRDVLCQWTDTSVYSQDL